jgi:N-methylhydantoinase A
MSYVIGIDTGGTFTDTVIVDDAGNRVTGKSETTPDAPTDGIINSLDDAVTNVGNTLEDVLSKTETLFHGTTLTTNTVIERTGKDVGLITTKGHADAIHIGRTITRTTGLTRQEKQHYAGQKKPEPIVPKSDILELDARIDYKGAEIVGLDESEAREQIEAFVQDVGAVAVNMLWSFENPAHEQQIAEIISDVAPELPVYLSHEVAPKLGEYERGVTTAINAYTAPVLENYLERLSETLSEQGLDAPLYLMSSTGGAMPFEEAPTRAVGTIMSGPTGGVIGAQHLGSETDRANLICTDVGGTSFDVGLVIDGEIQTRQTSSVQQYSLYQLSVDVDSIGSGGGSIAGIDEGGALRVGPKSAGADPGPACYGRGGTRPTVTDADLLLGYIDPEYFLGGRRDLDAEAAREAMRTHVADHLDMSIEEAAAGVFEIVNGAMADLLRQMTVERGHDPREFSVLAYGGAGPLHAPFYADDLGAESVIVPLGDTAGVFSAYGIATSDLNWVEEAANPDIEPFDPADIVTAYDELSDEIRQQVTAQNVDWSNVQTSREIDLRYKGQVHELAIGVPNGELTESDVDKLLKQWEEKYEARYGSGSTYADAAVELVSQRLMATAETTDPTLGAEQGATDDPHTGTREVYWPGTASFVETDIYDGRLISADLQLSGPAIIQLPDTTVTVRPQQQASIDEYDNIIITGE